MTTVTTIGDVTQTLLYCNAANYTVVSLTSSRTTSST